MDKGTIDRELRAALAEEDAPAATTNVARVVPTRASRGNAKLLGVLLLMGGGIVALVLSSFSGAAVYSKSVDQLLAERSSLVGRRVRVDGSLVHGSLEKRDQPCEYRFRMERAGAVMPVRFAQCVVPDTFRDVPNVDVGVTVEGKLAQDGSFDATQVLAKCPSKYDMKQQQGGGATMPHGEPPKSM